MTLWKNLVVALVAAFVLAACSSSDNSTDTGMTEPTTTMEPTPAEQIATLQERINALRAELGLDPVDIDDLASDVSDLQGQVSDLTQQIADRDKEIADAARKDMTVTGNAVFDVLDPLGNTTTPADSAIATIPPTVAAGYGVRTALTVTRQEAFVDGLASLLTNITADGEGGNAAFAIADAGDPATLAANGGFSGTMLTWANADRADTMTVYADISAPSSTLFSEAFGGGSQSIVSNTPNEGLAGPQAGVTGEAFAGRTGGTVIHKANAKSASTELENNVVKLPGSYMGAAGSYTCTPATATSCSSTASLTTEYPTTLITFSDDWTFTANTGAMVSMPDGNGYMTFGWWMRDDKATASPLDNVAVFYDANAGVVTAIADTDDFAGTATYEGGAAGKYAWQDVDEGSAHGGHFTAKANLTAIFTTGTGDDTLSGSISEFRIGDDGMDPDWTVTLSEAAISGTGAVVRGTGDTATMTTWAVGLNESSATAGWEAMLSDTGAKRNDDLPTGVAGAFYGVFGEQGRMVGAFGANITNANPPE